MGIEVTPPLQGRVAIVTGASRGIGREVALALARSGCDVVIAAKSVTDTPNLPGTIHSVAREIRDIGRRALAVRVDVRDDAAVQAMTEAALQAFGRIDVLVCNSGALWWQDVEKTPLSKWDLVHAVNARGVFSCIRAALPAMRKQGFGRIVVMSPPIDLRWLKGHVAYCCSKYAQTMLAIGLAEEVKGSGIAINALWPSTLVESYATKNFKMADRSQWRKATIISDCVVRMAQEPAGKLNGNALIAEEYLRSRGETDFTKYQCVAGIEPRKVWPPVNDGWFAVGGPGVPPGVQQAKL